MKIGSALATTAWLAASARSYWRFRRALASPADVQTRLLRDYLYRNAATAYGREHRFAEIRSYAEFARRVPISDYDSLHPWITRIQRGERAVLTRDAVTRLLPTSGSSGARKLIPFTATLQREFNAAIGPWMIDLCQQHPSIALGPAYWSVTPPGKIPRGDSAVPIGFDDDSEYLGGARARLVEAGMAVPSAVRYLTEIEQFRYVVLLCLLRRPDLRLISVWHPSFLTLLLDQLPRYWNTLIADLETGDCRAPGSLSPLVQAALDFPPRPGLSRRLRELDPTQPRSLWPQLQVVSCWSDGHAGGAASELQRRLPGVVIQPKGLLATEGVVTFPFANAHPLAVCSHFFEFVDERGAVHLGETIRPGQTYEVVVTTGGGLWRYRLGDRVEVNGFVDATPSLRFLGRAGNVSDHCGEKLSEAFVASVIAAIAAPLTRPPAFAMLAPEVGSTGPHYTLYLEAPDSPLLISLAAELETALCANPHYALCRALGQLGAARIFPVPVKAYAVFAAAEVARGRRLGDLKPVALSQHTDWSAHFSAAGLGVTAIEQPTGA